MDENQTELVYPRDLQKMMDMFELYCIRTQEAFKIDLPFKMERFHLGFAHSYPYQRKNHFGQTTTTTTTPMYHMHYQRTNCLDTHYSIRLYYQKRVDILVHKLMKQCLKIEAN